ncbi:MAG: hypothetical protein A3B91_00805 [Candidatus Yanofskybacteria bacterium RIFCSPHIGHO2_02_FULL_41_29]|uniref:Uncharacterized protein n=1 Tax=Candidatus Yanofskybacteria bacterium RIFCSPHIGHO2_01_FULL_41_53 TaxID=1802663 RepID=A0A1F8EJY5_9BACT|nr:MAG: hypothetical protein A2650_00375 [Candidatus Yanofskybacteria bacterium RIFCSPHIGHO2_01_FULL_41_53]OGN12282.1 MAG: hypothetical protein A3B91_00805 [Candidatus Yanofskybacteria bacterium RIFCSPHIGHO2_02_FULL_41_29]OGN17019.1 MAG: hypothetical protein A3F48_03675 [Candidatus Yanofskybacteria bacterium RIFCSPHIGHO2_12_FULL_41_9]OGN23619.1 MAG: hypothetical protein A2916_01510 [Candidatus Yanofskybacteria bacterium RIFCSPLOWO2_01_FULL_41_67]OGN29394.1 MAG: hypothetical protein A3H54_04015 
MVIKPKLFFNELALFAATMILGVFSAYSNAYLIENTIIEPPSFSWDSITVFLVFFVIFSLILMRFKKLSGFFLRIFLIVVVFSGSQILFGSAVASPWELFLALFIAIVFLIFHNVWSHNVGIMLGVAGVSSLLGAMISPQYAVILLVLLSFYDIAAVYWTKHMVYLAKGMIESGAIFGFIIPFDMKDIFYHKEEARQHLGSKFMILGSGDIGLPLVLASSLAVVSISQALVVALFSLGGLFLTHILFINQEGRKPMAALPPIATLTIIGYVVTQLL